ncbi:MAG: hypothetical protein J6C75_00830, partial [Oscillospiraceae bacterium]|nr:hypothetical protein [Oscillospiraceae bacterium]
KYQNRFRIVTLDGQVINRGGSMTGGSVNRSAGVLSRANDLKALQKLLDNETLSLPVTVSQTISAGMETINSNTMYTNGAFQNSYELRNILERSIQNAAANDRAAIEASIELGLDRS